MDSSVSLMHHDPDRSWITDPDPDHPKGTQSLLTLVELIFQIIAVRKELETVASLFKPGVCNYKLLMKGMI